MKTKYVLIDLMFTIANTPIGKDRFDQYQTMFKGYGLKASRELIEEIYGIARKSMEGLNYSNIPSDLGDITAYAYKWASINEKVITETASRLNVAVPNNPIMLGLEIYERLMGDPTLFVVREEMREFLDTLINNKIKVVLATNQELELVQRMLEHHGLFSRLEDIIVSDQIGHEKPEPEFFNCVLNKLGVEAGDVAMVGNNLKNDLGGAAKVGIKSLFLLNDKEQQPEKDGLQYVWANDPREFLPHLLAA